MSKKKGKKGPEFAAKPFVDYTIDRKNPKPRLLVVEHCCDCPYSRDRDICSHPSTPDRTGDLGWGDPPIRYRVLPEADPKVYGYSPANGPPPDWCPLEVKP